MGTETTLPSESVPEPDASTHIFLTGNASIRSMAPGGVTHTSDTPLPLRAEADAAILAANWGQPQQPLPPRPATFIINEPPAAPPFPLPELPPQQSSTHIISEARGHAAGVGGARAIVIGRAVATNQVAIRLATVSLLNALNAKLEALYDARSNSEDAAVYENLKRLVEAFLAAQRETDEKPVVESTLSLAAGIRNWWTKDHLSICKSAMNISLFTGGLTVCALAGALGVSDASIVTVGALVGGKDVVGALNALTKILHGND